MVAFSTCNPQRDALMRAAAGAFSDVHCRPLPSPRTVCPRSGHSAPQWRRRGPLRTDLRSRHPRTPCCCCSRCPPTLPASSWKTTLLSTACTRGQDLRSGGCRHLSDDLSPGSSFLSSLCSSSSDSRSSMWAAVARDIRLHIVSCDITEEAGLSLTSSPTSDQYFQ